MSLFGALVRTAVNVVTLPVAVVADVVTLGGDSVDGGKTYTQKHLEALKDEAEG